MFIRHFKLNFNNIGNGNLECGIIACLKDSGFKHIDYSKEFEKVITKSIRPPKSKKYGYGRGGAEARNRFTKQVGSSFAEIRAR